MSIENYISRMKKATHDEFEQLKKADESPEQASPEPVDLYRQKKQAQREESRRIRPNGASKIIITTTNAVVNGVGTEGLAKAYRRAKSDSECLSAKGNTAQARMVREQYMEEYFLPAVELVANSASPDELLNSKQALDTLDEYALLEGSGRGYTAAYIKQAYANQLGQRSVGSDGQIRDGVRRLNAMLDTGELRLAIGLARELKQKIDRGDAMADDADYDLIGRVVAFYA